MKYRNFTLEGCRYYNGRCRDKHLQTPQTRSVYTLLKDDVKVKYVFCGKGDPSGRPFRDASDMENAMEALRENGDTQKVRLLCCARC